MRLDQRRHGLLVMLYRVLCAETGHDGRTRGTCSVCGLRVGEAPHEAEIDRPIPILEEALAEGAEP